MDAAAECVSAVGYQIGVNPVGSDWIRQRIVSILSAPRDALGGDGSWQALRQAVHRRVASHPYARTLSPDDLDDIAGEVLVRVAPALMCGESRVRYPGAFLARVVSNQFHQLLRKSGPVWTSLKDEIVDIARGRRGDHGLSLWDSDGTALIGLSEWCHRRIHPTEAYINTLAGRGLRRMLQREGLHGHYATPTLLRGLIRYLDTPVPVSHLVNLLFELRRLRDVRWISLDHLISNNDEPTAQVDLTRGAEVLQAVREIARACETLDDQHLAAFVLHLEGDVARCLLGESRPALASRVWALFALAFPPDGRDALRELPVPDAHTAMLLKYQASSPRDAQTWISNLRRSAQRRVSRVILDATPLVSVVPQEEAQRV